MFTVIIFYQVGQMTQDVQWRNREKKNEKNIMKRQVLFIYLSFRTGFLFFFWKDALLFTSYVICSFRKTFKGNSQKQPFTNVLQNFSIFARKHLCWSLFLTKLQAWGMYIVLLWNFIWWYNSLIDIIRFCYFFYCCFVFLHNPSVWIGSTWLFRTCFRKFLVRVTFARITTSASVLFWLIC